MRPQVLDDLGLEAALRWLARTFAENHGLPVRLDLAPELPSFSGDLSTLIFRVVQEALTNVVKHAAASQAEVVLRCVRGWIALEIRDDGRGCDPAAALATGALGCSSGLGGMRDRTQLFSGEFQLAAQPGRGCRVMVKLPLPESATGRLS